MANFQGMTVQLTLHQPPNTVLHGVVKEVIAGQTLTLQDVFFPSTGARWEQWTVQGSAIADLQVIGSSPTPIPTIGVRMDASQFPAPDANAQGPLPRHEPQPPQQPCQSLPTRPPPPRQPSPASFVDPAILSYGKSPVQSRTTSRAPPPAPATPIKSKLAKAAESLPINSSPFVAGPTNTHGAQNGEEGQGDNTSRKKVRRGQKKKANPQGTTNDPPAVMNAEVSRNGNDMNGGVERGKGWRQTPLLQPSPQTLSPANRSVSRKKNRKEREQEREVNQNGWATEDATDIQGMDDFDFEANHKLFDKKQVFNELRQGDTTADEDRLVGHNRLPRPGTYGGKNIHPTENVLSPKLQPKHLGNDVDSTSDADTELNFANGRSSSRHSKKQPSRQNSTPYEGKSIPLAASVSSDRGGMNRTLTSLSSRGPKNTSIAASSPRPDRTQSPHSAISTTKSAFPPQSSGSYDPHFVIQHTLTKCPLLHPSALHTLETETVARYGLTHEAITETAARSISESAMTLFDGYAGSRRESRATTVRGSMTSSMLLDRTSLPVIVILAGNHTIGARAIAAARHLIGRRTKIILAEALFESTETQDAQMRTQTSIIKRMMRGGANIKRGPWRKASEYIKNLNGPPAVIIDALLGGSTYDSLLDSNMQRAAEAQKEAREMIDWANRSRAPVLSVGCPSGVSGIDGSATIVDGEPLAVRPEKVVCLGAPMQGLLAATKAGERWDMTLADIGINIALRSDEAVVFGAQWVADLKFVEESSQEAGDV
ncbi:YjeF N-terminal domain-like protein [Acrodontium crateriforme]|uniref:YjeF N-terminal domain-like protein n=1 Tax=Acrodontium crateriforme TaxID=150365 RepID=A0AAQ3M4E9_9PEZI|nr:YjeF N-terminal domain-like protein [Acrodontium crateriforme]